MNIPSATYRLQFNHEFTFAEAETIVNYLNTLGISTIYASPIFEATPKSLHGYDVSDSNQINKEIGTLEELRELSFRLKGLGMGWLQDIVPNHMSFSVHNKKLMDVLERGKRSEFFHYFDILWDHPSPLLHDKVMMPVLTEEIEASKSKIKLAFEENGFFLIYADRPYPLSPSTFHFLLADKRAAELHDELHEWVRIASLNQSREQWDLEKRNWLSSLSKDPAKVASLTELFKNLSGSAETIRAIEDLQNFRLMPWQSAAATINYRRFFTINELIGLRMEDSFTFRDYHTLLAELYRQEIIQGLRIDHIDGLFDPFEYCRKLRDLFGPDCYIIAEKILAGDEDLPRSWPLQGTSGYEFLSEVNQLFTDKTGAKELTRIYERLIPDQMPYSDLIVKNKLMILQHHMGGEWDNLNNLLFALKLDGGLSKARLKDALGALLISLPVYRIYPAQLPLKGKSGNRLKTAFDLAHEISPRYNKELNHLADLFFSDTAAPTGGALDFLRRMMQFTGPITAKGVEDTTFYSFNPLISHDEVGESPATMAVFTEQFHEKMIARRQLASLSLNATSTHDTKRGEDARLRLNVLSEIPQQWHSIVTRWIAEHQILKTGTFPTLNDQYFIYQSIIGGFPPDLTVATEWLERLKAYIVKVVREGKINSDWASPNVKYENACSTFIDGLFEEKTNFLDTIVPFIKRIDSSAFIYSLASALIKITTPGIPDFYQGSELFNHSFVDPDNRRKVDYEHRKTSLNVILDRYKEAPAAFFAFLKQHRQEGLEKLFLIWKALNFRKSNQSLFLDGEYLPLRFSTTPTNAMAYARVSGEQWAVIVVPLNLEQRMLTTQTSGAEFDLARILFPPGVRLNLTDVFTGERFETMNELTLGKLFKFFPVALLTGKTEQILIPHV